MRGKEKCRILREIRMDIARSNGIPLVIDECGHRGECRGTCPRCEAEVRYLEEQLERRRRFKKAVAVAGISVGMVAALSGCSAIDKLTDMFGGEELAGLMPPPTPAPTEEMLIGEVAPAPTPIGEVRTDGEIAPDPDLLMGRMPLPEAAPEPTLEAGC